MRRLLSSAASIITTLGFLAGNCAAQTKPLVLLGDSDYPPMSYLERGEPRGMDVEAARAIAKAAGRQLRIELMDWETAQQKVLHGEADGVLSMTLTDERKKQFDFTEAIVDHEFGILVRSDDVTIHGVNDLAGKVVGVTPGGYPRAFLSAIPEVRLVLVENSQKGMDRLAAGTIDAVASDLWVAAYFIQKRHLRQIAIAGEPFATRPAAIAFRKGNADLLRDINRGIAKTRADGTLDKIMALWRPQEMVYFSIESVHRLVLLAGTAFLLLVVGGMAVWVRTLKRQIRFRQAVEAELLESRQRLEVALSAAHLGTWRWCASTNMVTRDANLSRMLGLEPVEATYQILDVFQRVHPDDVSKTKESFLSATRDRNPFAVEYRIMRPDGTVRWFRLQGKPFFNGSGELVYVSGAIVDITERKDAEEERRRLEAQLRQAHKMETVGRLAGGIAHDFNNLLTVINGYSALVASRTDHDAITHRQATEIRKAGERAAALTQQLLAFSRKQVTQAQPVHLNAVLDQSLNIASGILPQSFELRRDFRARPDWVVADPGQIQTALANLLANAREAMPRGGWLRIETASVEVAEAAFLHGIEVDPGSYVRLTVVDSGVGMDAEIVQHIFEPFFTTKEEGTSSGLGLSTVYGIVRQCGGFVEVESQPGSGASFHLYFPLSRAEPTVAPSAVNHCASTPLSGTETILVVEDEGNVRELAMETLRSYGYSVLGAENGQAALRTARDRAQPIHLLLTDVVMPGMNGRALAEQIRPLRPETKVLYMSGYNDDLITHHGMLEAGIAYIAKPFSGEALAAKVRNVLDVSSHCRTILVADDEEAIRSLLEELLAASGYHVLLASDGKEVFDILQSRNDVDLVITDLVMPQQEGIETVQAIRRQYPAIKVVAMSGAFGGRLLKTVKLLGAHATLTKPIHADELKTTVDRLLA